MYEGGVMIGREKEQRRLRELADSGEAEFSLEGTFDFPRMRI